MGGKQVQDFCGVLEMGAGRPFFDGARPWGQVPPASNHPAHARRLGRIHVALVISDIDEVRGLQLQSTGRREQRIGPGFGMRAGVSTDEAAVAWEQAQLIYQRLGETCDLVGDDAPGYAPFFQFLEEGGNRGEEVAFPGQPGFVEGKEFIP